MEINIKTTNLNLTPALNQYIEEKIGSLSKFLKNYEIDSEIQARVEVARSTRHHHGGNVFMAEKEDIRLAINKVRDEMRQEIKKYKGLCLKFRARRAKKF